MPESVKGLFKKSWFKVCLCLCLPLTGLAAEVNGTAPEPWAEGVLQPPFAQEQLQGTLDAATFAALHARGEHLFSARFTREDGAGRPLATQAIIPTKRKRPVEFTFRRTSGLDANACVSCHNVPVTGGAGDFTANVFVSEGFTNADFDSLDPQFSNERNTNHLLGAGLIELLAREMTQDLQAIRHTALQAARSTGAPVKKELLSKGVSFGYVIAEADGVLDLAGISGVDSDLIIRPFSQKGVFASLRQFTINALNHHHGMQATELFGARWTGEADFDEDGVVDEFEPGDVSALVAWQAALPPPVERPPDDLRWQQAAARGKDIFTRSQCASCHQPTLPLHSLNFADPGPLDGAGTLRQGELGSNASAQPVYDLAVLEWAKTLPRNPEGEVLVPLFGDLKRHKMADAQVAVLGNELLSQRFVERDTFMTAELWGVASTAPYGHRGDLLTLDEVIRAHGGDARPAREAYVQLDAAAQSALIAYLKTLVIGEEQP